MKAMLVDTTRCVGCRGCQIACKEWNNLPAEKTRFFAGNGYQNPHDLSSKTWTLITYNDVKSRKGYDWVFGKRQCFHCNEPACATVCPVSALRKTENGPVVYDKDRCLGCRYCQMACPFDIPRFDWDQAVPEIKKCNMCADRIEAGMEPACSKACPTDAIIFGEREDLIKDAEARIARNPLGYIHHIYGKDEAGGTCVMHLSNVPFEQLGYPAVLFEKSLDSQIKPAVKAIPFVMSGLGLGLGGLYWIINRRIQRNDENQHPEGGNQ